MLLGQGSVTGLFTAVGCPMLQTIPPSGWVILTHTLLNTLPVVDGPCIQNGISGQGVAAMHVAGISLQISVVMGHSSALVTTIPISMSSAASPILIRVIML